MLSRRELLTLFLGAPLAAARCRDRNPPLPPGELVGASHQVGHRLRGAPPPFPSERELQDVVIVGAGVSGLAAAWRFAHAGFHDFTIFELEPQAGGTSRSGRGPLTAYPWGAHYVPAPMSYNRPLVRLFDELGLFEGKDVEGHPIVAEQFLCRDPQERLFYRGRWYEGLYLYAGASAEDLRQLRIFEGEIDRWVAFRDARGRRAFAIPRAYGSDNSEVTELDRISMAQFLDRLRLTSPRLRWFVEYGCRDDYGSLLADTSAWAGVFYFASRMSLPRSESRPLITWPEGNGRLVNHLAKSARRGVETGWLVAGLAPDEEGIDVTALSSDGRRVRGIRAKQIVFAAQRFLASHIIEPWRSDPPPDIAETIYGSWMVANLTLRDRPFSRGFPLAWDNVLYESPSLGYVVATHQSGIDHGGTVLSYYYPLAEGDARHSRERLLAAGRDEWADVVLTDLSRAHPELRSITERIDIMRWGHAMIRPRPGFIWGESRRNVTAPFRGIHFANADLSGIPLFEEAFYHGIRAAEEILKERGRLEESFL